MAKAKANAAIKPTKKAPAKNNKQAASKERERKKLQEKRKKYATSTLILVLFLGGMIAYQQRIDRVIADYLYMAWIDATKQAGFTLEELIVKNRKLTKVEDVVEAVGLNVGDSLFQTSLGEIHQKLLYLPMVKEAHVTRDLSGRIIIDLHERKPYALWQFQDKLRVIDAEGIVLARANPDEYPNLITVVGENAPQNMQELISFLPTEKNLSEEVVAAVYVSDRRWDVHFVSGVQIMLPENNPRVAWKRLAKMHKKHDILQQKLQAIDLRIEDKIYITLPDEQKIETDIEGASDI
jgi:cell division protein FtsQ